MKSVLNTIKVHAMRDETSFRFVSARLDQLRRELESLLDEPNDGNEMKSLFPKPPPFMKLKKNGVISHDDVANHSPLVRKTKMNHDDVANQSPLVKKKKNNNSETAKTRNTLKKSSAAVVDYRVTIGNLITKDNGN